ncbi:O-antigen polysaccharide polymerase Wzy family protein [Bacillus toyonensis]|uniref:Oligosaccharide repeat unit polymerase n=1 Tax=Bacillus toyonensis TaxID=155322 RepID=A0AB36TBG9_9BACI|nr:O-antigen polysaccharide polymerase Wzy family protein [Bacillus toyonensis]PEC10790.1 oligosaccharide repeat unit polymerase [Bacillus toyonensis]PEN92309.1 oligosaccharide repeat unit polymerase [Bacillus toyonensis]
MQKIIRYIILFFAVSMFGIGALFSNLNILLIAICGMLIHNLLYSCEKFSERIIFFAFNSTFFTFLVARLVVKPLFGYYDRYNNNYYGLDFDDEKVIWSIFISLFFSLLFLFLGYALVKNNRAYKDKKLKFFGENNIKNVALVSKSLFYVTYIFNVLVLWDKAKFTNNVGYTELYASYTSSFPIWVTKLAEMCPTALFIYLGTLPTKKKSFIPLVLYVLSGCLSLAVGQRNNFVLNILIVLVYLCLRNYTDKKEKWFGKKEIIACVCALPIMILLLNAVSYLRMDTSVEHSFLDGIIEFFYAQGVSVNLIGYAQTLTSQLPEGKIYTIGRLIDFINSNAITQLLIDVPKYVPQSLDSALYGNNFAESVSYILSPNRYLNGWGYGSSYVAELYKDFSYFGIIIGNFVLGLILGLMNKLFRTGILGAWMCLSMTRLLLYAPRDTFTSFFVSTFSLINTLTVCLILLGAIILSGKKQKRVQKTL